MTAFWIACLIATFGVAMMSLGVAIGSAPERSRKKEKTDRDLGTPWKVAMRSDEHSVVVWYQRKGNCTHYSLSGAGEHPTGNIEAPG